MRFQWGRRGGSRVACSSCGKTITPGAAYCGGCGAPVAVQVLQCQACGAEPGPGARFCGACGAAINGVAAAQAESPAAARRKFIPFGARSLVGLLAAVAVIGVVLGALSSWRDDTLDPTSDQRKAIAENGLPPIWVLGDGPVAPGEDAHRIESWFYPATGQVLRFVDGQLLDSRPFSGAGWPQYELQVDPTRLHRELSRGAVKSLLGETGVAVPGVQSPYQGSEAFFYRSTGLLVTYLDGRFFTGQHHVAGRP
ncbi:MAG: hypothetical protein C0506_09720 [Anaerolinea sp.]|nr:hypothetical protein [Anaerolinea sp.]